MKKITTILSALLIMLSFSNTASAAPQWVSSKLKNVYPLGDGKIVILIFKTPSALCSGTYYYAQVGKNGMTDKGLEYLFSTALTALATDKTLAAAFDDGAGCYINRVNIAN